MTMDRWGDSTHKMSAYNNRYHPSNRDQRQIDRMKKETMVLYPTLQPNPVLPMRSPGFSGGRGVFPRGHWEALRGLNWRAEGLRVQPSRNEIATREGRRALNIRLLQTAKRSSPFCHKKKIPQKKSFQKATQKNALPSIPPIQR